MMKEIILKAAIVFLYWWAIDARKKSAILNASSPRDVMSSARKDPNIKDLENLEKKVMTHMGMMIYEKQMESFLAFITATILLALFV